MRIAVFGASGCMGNALLELLSKDNYVIATSRREHENTDNTHWLKGDCHDMGFAWEVLSYKPDCIVDFMIYRTDEFKKRVDVYLSNVRHYIFVSSSRVYAKSVIPMNEQSPRLLDTTDDKEYLKTDEYALAKARQEDILRESGYRNYTIVRPFLTYNFNRLQLGTYEKEYWLNRALRGEPILFPKKLLDVRATMTYAGDVAKRIACIAGKVEAYERIIIPATPENHSWGDIIHIYRKVIYKLFGVDIDIVLVDSYDYIIDFFHNRYQMIYARAYDRMCNPDLSEALYKRIDPGFDPEFTQLETGIESCLKRWAESMYYRPTERNAWDDQCNKLLNSMEGEK